MADTPENIAQAQLVYPAAADPVSVTPAASIWSSSSAYTQLIASTASAIIICGITVLSGTTGAGEFEVDIAVGAASAEVVVGTLRGVVKSVRGTTVSYIPFPIPINNIGSAQRVSVRMRKDTTVTTAWFFALVYFGTGTLTGVTTTANKSQVIPSAAAGSSVTPSNTDWVNSAYTQMIASTASAIILAGLVINFGTTPTGIEVDIATGGAGSETVITTFRPSPGTVGLAYFLPFENPLDKIANATRIAVRMRKQGTLTTVYKYAILYYNKPL